MKIVTAMLTLLSVLTMSAQKENYSSALISDELKENANAVVRLNDVFINIASQRMLTIKTKRVVTVLNKLGMSSMDSYEHYDPNTKIKKIEARIFDALGNEIKTIKRKDFKDVSVNDGFSVFNDNRLMYYEYTPIHYPFTFVFETETETSNTAFLPKWSPVDRYYTATEKTIVNVVCLAGLGFKYKELNFSAKYTIEKKDADGSLTYTASNIKAVKYEDYCPSRSLVFPEVIMGLNHFHLEGVDGTATTWKDMGLWFSSKILFGVDNLSEETKEKIRALTASESDPIKKARIVYRFVQEKSRYVSVQEGIGGWKPMLAKDVDRLGYGDCKALTNYTKALLAAVDVPSYYTRLYGDSEKRSVIPDFVSMQSNHVMLAIPNGDDYIWLECTSQTSPFGYQGTFTDDRNVLVLKPDGGEIVRTKKYNANENLTLTTGSYTLMPAGNLVGNLSITSSGTRYENVHNFETLSESEKDNYYKEYFDNLQNVKLNKVGFKNDTENIKFTQNIELSAPSYATNSADKLMFVLNAFNINSNSPKRYRNRENSFEIDRGYKDYDEITVNLPQGYTIEALPQDLAVNTKFGEYKTEIIKSNPTTLIYKRTFFVKDGLYDSKEYDEYRLFREQVSKNDNAKIILTKKQ